MSLEPRGPQSVDVSGAGLSTSAKQDDQTAILTTIDSDQPTAAKQDTDEEHIRATPGDVIAICGRLANNTSTVTLGVSEHEE